jgi:hypothetical protein
MLKPKNVGAGPMVQVFSGLSAAAGLAAAASAATAAAATCPGSGHGDKLPAAATGFRV